MRHITATRRFTALLAATTLLTGGLGAAGLGVGFANAAEALSSVSPAFTGNTDSTAANTSLTFTTPGTEFTPNGTTTVSLLRDDLTPASSYTVTNTAGTATVNVTREGTPPTPHYRSVTARFDLRQAAPGQYSVQVAHTPAGGTTVVYSCAAGCFTVNGFRPTVAGIAANTAPNALATSYIVSGTDFAHGSAVSFVRSGTTTADPAVTFTYTPSPAGSTSPNPTANSITGTLTPGGTGGTYDIVVTNTDRKKGVCSGCLVLPKGGSVYRADAPNQAPALVGQGVTTHLIVKGDGFSSSTTLSFTTSPNPSGAVAAINIDKIVVVDPQTLDVTVDVDDTSDASGSTSADRNTRLFDLSISNPGGPVTKAVSAVKVSPRPTVDFNDAFLVCVKCPDEQFPGAGTADATVLANGLPIKFTGTNFQPLAQVSFVPPTGITVVGTDVTDSTHMAVRVRVAANAPLTSRNLVVTNPDLGVDTGLCSGCITPAAAPVLNSASLPSRFTNPSSDVNYSLTLPGSNLSGDSAVTPRMLFTDTNITAGAVTLNYNSAGDTVVSVTSTITVKASTTAGPKALFYLDGNGAYVHCLTPSGGECFTIDNLSVTAVNPSFGTNDGPAILTISGGPFSTTPVVALQRAGQPDIIASTVTVNPGGTSVTATVDLTTASPASDWIIRVTNPNGNTGALYGAFQVVAQPPTFTALTPSSAPAGSTVTVTATGTKFARGAKNLTFSPPAPPTSGNDIKVLSSKFISTTTYEYTLQIPAGAALGPRNVTYANSDGQSPAVPCSNCFTISAAPAVSSVTPATRAPGSATFTMTVADSSTGGTAFNGTPTVTFDGTGVTAGTATAISAKSFQVPVTVSGTAELTKRKITVKNGDGGTAVCNACFTVVPGPTVSTITPNLILRGASNVNVTVTGKNFGTQPSLNVGSGVSISAVTPSTDGTSLTAVLSVAANASPRGFRDVTVTNTDAANGGTGVRAALLGIGDLPAAPTLATPTRLDRAIGLSWTPGDDGGIPITGYTVTVTKTADSSAVTPTIAYQGTTALVSGLVNGTSYTFVVKATNGLGTGPNSVSQTGVPAKAPDAPLNVAALAGDTTASVSWSAVTGAAAGGDPVTSYTVTSSPAGGTVTYPTNRTSTGAAITGLTNGTSYTFTITATNGVGTSLPSGPSNSVIPAFALPGAPTGLAADPNPAPAAVSLSWTPSTRAVLTPTTSYTVSVSPNAGTVNYPADRTVATATVTGLTNGTTYAFTVVANNSAGSSVASASASATPYGVPSAVTGLSGSAGNTIADLTWTAPSNGGSAITGYSAVLSPGNKVGTISGTTAHFTGLTNGTDYTATVFAVNARGNGPSATTGPLHPATVPTAPLNPTATPGKNQATVSWTAPADPGGLAITGYTVTSSPDGKTATVDGNTTSAVVTGLTNGTAYTFTVVATNGKGNSPASAATSPVTPDLPTPVITGLSATASTGGTPASTVTGKVDDSADTVGLKATDSVGGVITGTATVDAAGNFTGSLDLTTLADGAITVTATATNTDARTATATTSTTRDSASRFVPLAPVRVLDTRSGTGAAKAPVLAMGALTLQVTGAGGVPSTGVAAVVLNVTVTGPTAAGYVTAYPTGTARPTVSNLNFTKGQTVPNLVVVPVGNGGRVTLFNGSKGTTQLLADVAGYFTTGSNVPAGAFGSLTPARLLDTRNGTGAARAPVGRSGVVSLQVAGQGGVPATGVSAVILNVTVTAAKATGYLTAYPSGTTRPTASNLNFVTGQTVPNLVIVPVGADGKVSFYNGSNGTIEVLADIAGFYRAGTSTFGGAFTALSPSRVLDTRNGTGAPLGAVPGNGNIALQATGAGGVPTTGVSAVVLNVTVTGPIRAGYLTAYPEGTTQPVVSNLNFLTGQTVPNLVIVPVGSTGKVTLFNGSQGQVNVIADVAGYFS